MLQMAPIAVFLKNGVYRRCSVGKWQPSTKEEGLRKLRMRQKRQKAKEIEIASGKAKTRGEQPAPRAPEPSDEGPRSCLADWNKPWM